MKFQTEVDRQDLARMAELGKDNYGGHNNIANIPFLEWQYFDNPAGTAMLALAIDEDSGELAGEIAQIPLRFRYFGEEITATCLVNSLIRKKYRNLSLFYELQTVSFDSCKNNAFAFGVPNLFSYPLFSRLFSCKTVAQIPLLLLPVHPKALVRQQINRTAAKVIPDITYKGMPGHVSDKIAVETLSMDGIQVLDDFWENVKDKYRIMEIRTSDHIAWRYLRVPTRDYAVFIARDGAEVLGYCVVGHNEVDGIKTGYIMDFLVLPGRRDAAAALLKQGVARLIQIGVDLIGALMFSHCEEYGFLKRHGFVNCPKPFLPQPFPLIIRTNDPRDDEKSSTPENWFLTMGDYDAV